MNPKVAERLLNEMITKGAIQSVLGGFCRDALDKKTVNGIRKAAESTVDKLSKTLTNIRLRGNEGAHAVLCLPLETRILMTNAFDLKTFEMKIDETRMIATIRKDKNEMYAPIHFTSIGYIEKARSLQKASIVSEAIFFVLAIAETAVPANDHDTIKKVIAEVDRFLHHDDIYQGISNNILQIMDYSKDTPSLIKNIVMLVFIAFGNRLLWNVMRLLYAKMSWYDMVLNAAKIAGFIGLMSTTTGIARFAELYSMLVNDSEFMQKLENLRTLDKMRHPN